MRGVNHRQYRSCKLADPTGTAGRTVTSPLEDDDVPRRAKRREADDPLALRNITLTTPGKTAIEAEKAKNQSAGPPLHLCPGPEWPPETTTCGRMLTHPGRCAECSAMRTRLRKAERRQSRKNTEPTGPNQERFELALPTF